MFKKIAPKPEIGKVYKVIVDGYEGLAKYEGPYKPNHCATCTCEDKTVPQWIAVDNKLPAGISKEFRIISEVK